MQTEETKDTGTKAEGAEFGCCNPENFKKMFEMMSKCCKGQDGSIDCSAMADGMMKTMMEMCCSSETDNSKSDKEHEKA